MTLDIITIVISAVSLLINLYVLRNIHKANERLDRVSQMQKRFWHLEMDE